jgi:hypothetical protein
MVVLIGLVDTEAQYDFVDEQGFGKIEVLAAKIGAGLEHQLVDAGNKIVAFENRLIQAAIAIGLIARQFLQLAIYPAIDPIKHDLDSGSRLAQRSIENMCSQPPHLYPLVSRGGKVALFRKIVNTLKGYC